MSFDVRLRTRCEHRLTGVIPTLDTTSLRDLRFPYSMASRRDFKLKVNGEYVLEGTPGAFEYYLVKDELSRDDRRLKVQFTKPLPSLENDFEGEFVAIVSNCPRCRGTEVETDPRPDGQGAFRVVENEPKLFQEVERFETVERDSMVFYTRLGTDLKALIGTKQMGTLQRAQIQAQIRQVLTELQRLQEIQRRYQTVTEGEILHALMSVTAQQDSSEKTMILVNVQVQARSGRSLEVRRIIEADRQYNVIPGSTYTVRYV